MSGIKDFYAGQSVFVTGSTGFLGAILVEKLVRSCPDLNNVYLLIRDRHGVSSEARLQQLLELPVFDKLEVLDKSKIIAVSGDLQSEDLGLCQSDLETLQSNVSIILHVAANINFSSRLMRSVESNVLGTRKVLQLAKKIPGIKSFVYVSTAYCNCDQKGVIKEKVYPCKWSPEELANSRYISTFDEPAVQKQILGGHPNPYSFSKLMAENIVLEERGDIPAAIVRPSIVLGTLKDPMPGWVYNVYNGQFAFIAGAGVGIFRTIFADPDVIADMVPSDQLASLVIASAYYVQRTKSLEVFNFSSGRKNPITWGEYVKHTIDGIRKYPLLKQVIYPKAKCRSSLVRNRLQAYLSHYIPAAILDLISPLTKEPPIQLGIQKKYLKGMEHSKYFTLNQFDFSVSNTTKLLDLLSLEDRNEFDFDVGHIDWKNYMENCVLGVRQYYHKEDLSTLAKARQSYKADVAIYYVFWFALVWILWYMTDSYLDIYSLPATLLVVLLYYLL